MGKTGCINFLPVEPAVFEAAFEIIHHHEGPMEKGDGDLYGVAPSYVESNGGDPADPPSYHQIPSTVGMTECGVEASEADIAIARARSFLELLKRPGGIRYGILYDGFLSDCDIAPHTYSVAATAPCCMVSGFDAKEFDDLWKQASILALAPSGSVWGQSLNGSEREWMQ